MTDQDQANYAELLQQLAGIDGWLARIDPSADRSEPQPHSPMSADDALLDPHHLSHAAWHSLVHAVDHLNCLRLLVRDARLIHMYAPYSLVRAALENASAAVWLLRPARRTDRATRRLRLAIGEIRNSEKAKRLAGQAGPRSEQERIDQVRQIAQRARVAEASTRRAPGYAEIVAAAGQALNADVPEYAEVCWRLCSGMAHGDFWPTFSTADRIELPGAPPGLGAFRITASVKVLLYVTVPAVHMTALGWGLYDQRSLSPF